MTAIDPSTCPPDQIYRASRFGQPVFVQRVDICTEIPWTELETNNDMGYFADSEVSDLVPLVPAEREVWAIDDGTQRVQCASEQEARSRARGRPVVRCYASAWEQVEDDE